MEGERQLTKRLVWSSVFIAVAAYTIFFSPAWFFLIVTEAFIILAMSEYFDLLSIKKISFNRYLGIFFGVLFPLASFVSGEPLVIFAALLCLLVFNLRNQILGEVLVNTSVTLFGILYIGWLFSFFMKLRLIEHGSLWVAYVILVTKLGDAGAYFIGSRIGRRKLALHISPSKTVEGAIGGFVTSITASVLSYFYLPGVSLLHLLNLGIFLGALSQLGDLVESLLKRDIGVKDSGRIPALGGILDVIDSILFSVPFVYYYVTLLLKAP